MRRTGELQEEWSEYLDEAEEALASLGLKADDDSVKKFLNRVLCAPRPLAAQHGANARLGRARRYARPRAQ